MSLKWKDEWSIGHEMVDSQHKELVDAVSNFINAYYAGKGADVIGETMDFLLGYTVKHFIDEEALQWSSNYPDYQNHKNLHEAFKVKAKELSDKLKEEGPSKMLVMKINSTISEWLVNHIVREDKKIGEHLKAKK